MNYINTQTLTQHTESDIRSLFPNTSFPMPFIAPDEYALVFPSPQPVHDALIQRAQEVTPVLTTKGHYEQQWEIVPRFVEYTDADDVLHTVAAQEAKAIADDTEAKRIAATPQVVTMRQARLALLGAGLLSSVNAAITSLPEPDKSAAQIEWEYAAVVQRESGLVPAMGAALGMTQAQLDALFVEAATL